MADTHIVVHSLKTTSDTLVVHAKDIDIFLLLVAHFQKISARNKNRQIWIRVGTAKKPNYISIHHLVSKELPQHGVSTSDAYLLLPCHALTGCDNISFLQVVYKRQMR